MPRAVACAVYPPDASARLDTQVLHIVQPCILLLLVPRQAKGCVKGAWERAPSMWWGVGEARSARPCVPWRDVRRARAPWGLVILGGPNANGAAPEKLCMYRGRIVARAAITSVGASPCKLHARTAALALALSRSHSSAMNGAAPERDESELLASQLNEAAVVTETDFDAQATLDDVQSRNPHCAVVALLPREGCEQPVGVTTSPAGLEVLPASVQLLNAAFFPAEQTDVIRLCGRELRVIERVEEGAHFLLVLSSGESSGGYAEYTQRGILLVLYDAGMTAAIARQLAVGVQEFVVADGV